MKNCNGNRINTEYFDTTTWNRCAVRQILQTLWTAAVFIFLFYCSTKKLYIWINKNNLGQSLKQCTLRTLYFLKQNNMMTSAIMMKNSFSSRSQLPSNAMRVFMEAFMDLNSANKHGKWKLKTLMVKHIWNLFVETLKTLFQSYIIISAFYNLKSVF